MKRKKFSRVRVESSDEEERKEDDREELAKQLFDSGDDDEGEDDRGMVDTRPEQTMMDQQRRGHSDLGSESETEVDDFIVDERGQPVRREDTARGQMSSAMREAEEIFGDGFEFDKIQEELEEDDFDEAEDEYSDE